MSVRDPKYPEDYMIKEPDKYYGDPWMVNVCRVCGKPIGTWPVRVEALCIECGKLSPGEQEETRTKNIMRPMTFASSDK
jgi:hypothetical protein